MGLLIEPGSTVNITTPIHIQAAPKIEIQTYARCNAGTAAGLSGSVAVSTCRFTIESTTSITIIATRRPIPKNSLFLIFMSKQLDQC